MRKNKLVIPLLAKSTADVPLHLEPSNYRDFIGAVPYDKQFQALLDDLGEGRGGASLKAEYRSTYVTAPPLPLNFVKRPDEQHDLRQALMARTDGVGVALTALEGMGGIGKNDSGTVPLPRRSDPTGFSGWRLVGNRRPGTTS